jgi:protein-tyrosine phosphatase
MGGTLTNGPFRVSFICTGNICRSPMAEVSFRQMASEDAILAGLVEISSAGTANWHVGSPMDARARAALDRAGFNAPGSPGAYADARYLNRHDLIIVMTREHVHDVRQRMTNESSEVVMLRNLLEPGLNLDVADPYYGDSSEFDACLEVLTRGGRRLTSALRQRLGGGSLEV